MTSLVAACRMLLPVLATAATMVALDRVVDIQFFGWAFGVPTLACAVVVLVDSIQRRLT